jgi:hypothetical protein
LTPGGSKPIEQFKEGDLVLSRDEADPCGRVQAKVVLAVFAYDSYVLQLRVAGRVIRTTAEHPFWVVGKDWLPANRLAPGDLLLTPEGEQVAVEQVAQTSEYERVYNLRIADFQTYFVGCEEWGLAVWAHNACATVYWYPLGLFDDNYPHLSVDTQSDSGNHIHTEMVQIGAAGTSTIISPVSAADAALATATATFQLPTGDAAQAYQNSVLYTTGPAWSSTNNCFTHVRAVLTAGGMVFASFGDFVRQMNAAFGFDIRTGAP